ncbi:PaaI family thioesterase [Gordonia sp. NPDC003376]
MSVLHIGHMAVEGNVIRADQQLCARFADHRGRIDLPALGVLFDHVGGIPFFRLGADAGALSMQARLTMSGLGHIDVDEKISCSAEVVMHDDGTGITTVDIRTSDGTLGCTGLARNMRVARPAAGDEDETPIATETPACDGHGIEVPGPVPAHLDGRDVIAEIAGGRRPIGPLAELLGGRVEFDGDSGMLRFIAATEVWMANVFGTMHGGVIATIIGQAFSLAGQAHAAAGKDYRVGDLSFGFYRSPAVGGVDVVVDVEPVKIGRRIAAFRATMVDTDGTLLADGSADIHYS